MVEYAKGRGGMSNELSHSDGTRFARLAVSKDIIGWRNFVEMTSKEWVKLQQENTSLSLGGNTLHPNGHNSWSSSY